MNVGISIYSNKKYKIKVLDSGKIPLSASEKGIKKIGYNLGIYTKGLVYIKIKIKDQDKIILFCSVHLATEKYDGMKNLIYLIEQIKDLSDDCDTVFLGGDFNFKIEKNGIDIFDKILKKGIKLSNTIDCIPKVCNNKQVKLSSYRVELQKYK
jgi:hypothetical protein